MGTRSANPPVPQPTEQPDLRNITVAGHPLEPGTEVSIRGKRGRFRFMRATTTSTGRTVLDFIGGTIGHETWHSFYPERVTSVHKTTTMRTWTMGKRP